MMFLTKVGKIVNPLLPFAQGFGRHSRWASHHFFLPLSSILSYTTEAVTFKLLE